MAREWREKVGIGGEIGKECGEKWGKAGESGEVTRSGEERRHIPRRENRWHVPEEWRMETEAEHDILYEEQ